MVLKQIGAKTYFLRRSIFNPDHADAGYAGSKASQVNERWDRDLVIAEMAVEELVLRGQAQDMTSVLEPLHKVLVAKGSLSFERQIRYRFDYIEGTVGMYVLKKKVTAGSSDPEGAWEKYKSTSKLYDETAENIQRDYTKLQRIHANFFEEFQRVLKLQTGLIFKGPLFTEDRLRSIVVMGPNAAGNEKEKTNSAKLYEYFEMAYSIYSAYATLSGRGAFDRVNLYQTLLETSENRPGYSKFFTTDTDAVLKRANLSMNDVAPNGIGLNCRRVLTSTGEKPHPPFRPVGF